MIFKLGSGFGHVLSGFRLINRRGIRRYVAMPLLINILIFGGVLVFGWNEFERLLNWITDYLPSWLDWLTWLLYPVFILTALLIVFYLFTPVANLIGAPFNALLAEKLERDLSGRGPEGRGGVRAIAASAGVAVGNELRKLFYMLVRSIPLLLLFVIPVINVAAPFIWALFGAWMLAIEYADYPMGNYDMKFLDERALLRKNRSLSLGFGGGILLMTMIPVLNFFAMPVGVAGATEMWVKHLRAQAFGDETGGESARTA
jgi:CysZ protein